jgi:hypothetical protein
LLNQIKRVNLENDILIEQLYKLIGNKAYDKAVLISGTLKVIEKIIEEE